MTLMTGIIEKGVHGQSRGCLLLSMVITKTNIFIPICLNSLRKFYVETGLKRLAWSMG
jgi:hypothetical protein